MDVIGIGNDNAGRANETLETAEEGMEADGEKLGTKRASLAHTTAGVDARRGGTILSEEQVSGGAVHGGHPREEIRKGGCDDAEELTTM